MTALKWKDFSGVVNEDKDKGKDKTTMEDNGKQNVCIHLFCMCGAILTVILGKTKKLRKGKGCESGQSKGWRGCWEHHKSCG